MERMTIAQEEQTFIEDLAMLEDWFLQYEYLLQLSCELPKLPPEDKTDDTRVPGCQSGVWLKLSYSQGKVHVIADSDALIIRGIIAIIVTLLNERTPQEIMEYEPKFIAMTNISKQISTDRFDGLHSVIKSIQIYAGTCI
ncbi:MAG: SufE family protein [Eubacterium sp.]|nr:SufE family protein [Eubacterium sp.]